MLIAVGPPIIELRGAFRRVIYATVSQYLFRTNRQTDKAAVSGQFDSCVRRRLVSFKKCEHVSHKI